MDITKAIEIIKEYGNGIGETDMLCILNVMLDDLDISNLERCARNLFMHEGRKMFESIKIQVTI